MPYEFTSNKNPFLLKYLRLDPAAVLGCKNATRHKLGPRGRPWFDGARSKDRVWATCACNASDLGTWKQEVHELEAGIGGGVSLSF